MKILNLMWGFNLGGIGKCYLTYAGLGKTDPQLDIKSVVINLQNIHFDLTPLQSIGAETIDIHNRKDISWIWKLRRLLKDFKPDAVFTHGFNGPVLMLVERFLGDRTPILCSYHGEYQAPTKARKLIEPIFNGVMHLCYKTFVSGVLTVCDYSSDLLIRQCGVSVKKVRSVHNGIQEQIQNLMSVALPENCNQKIVLGIASRLDPGKGIEDLLAAMPMIDDLPVHLLILGTGQCEKSLQEQSKKLNLTSKISFLGYQQNIAGWLQRFQIFMLPSHAECHSIALLEAMRAGLPIIATDVGGNGESVRDHQEALLVPARNPEALAKAIRTMAEDPDLMKKLGQNARKRFLEEFTEEMMCRKLADWLLSFRRETR